MSTAVVPLHERDRVIIALTDIEHRVATIPTVEEAMSIMAQADALRVLVRRAVKGKIVQNRCAHIKLLAQRRAGELLRDIPQAPIGGAQSGRGEKHTRTKGECLAAGGITPQTAARWELLADVPAALITKEWQRADAKGDDLTEKRIHDLARERRMRVRDARDPRRAAQMRRERAVDRAHAGLMRRVGAFLAEDSAEAQKLAVILADRTYVSAHDVKRLRDAFLALGARIAEACAALEQRMDVAMDVPLESSVLAGEDRQRMKAQLARGARPSARGSRRE